ncbi:sedoheptulokinase [Sphingobacterium sp. SYP-B4668]|uniref:sedoheptulokinase n=1 Tax=Sphingobacterium sp. SYP-B4668 TaxID=2996035 RepID=UPI0022DCFAC7|nr:FGGY family carbohydrate kinase [Sphingobacterium sp. SYP-B4668]
MHFIGIDIGTSSICGVAYDYNSKQIESITLENDTALVSAHAWEKMQDPLQIMDLVERILLDISSRYTDIRGIGVTGQMHGILYVNEHGDAVSPLYTWQDGRANQPFKANHTYVSFISDQSGYAVASGFGLATHFYNQDNGLVPIGAVKICTIMDFVVMKLSGLTTPLTDFSNGASLGFFDLENLTFDYPALQQLGIDTSFLPEISDSATFCGYYRHGVPVYSALGDNQAAFLGSVRDIHRSIHITVGTSSQISVFSPKFLKVKELETRPFPGGGYILVGAALCGGQALAMLRTFFAKTLDMFAPQQSLELDVYEVMNSILYKDDSNDLPVVSTLFEGSRMEPEQRGAIDNISLDNFSPENLVLAFSKGIVRELYNFYRCLPEDIKMDKYAIIGSGNALKKNAVLSKAFEEAFERKLFLSSHQEETAYGACLSAVIAGKYL